MKLPTIKEIARQLNISVSTVSRALNDHPRIGLITKTKVKHLAEELGYEPNAQAIFFKQKKTFTIGVVIPFIREEFFSQAISGIEATAVLNNYTILFAQSYDDLEIEKKVVGVMKKQRVDGLIISLTKNTKNYDHLAILDKYEIPIVFFDRVPTVNKVNKVCCDIFKGTIDLIDALYDRGYKRIALINGPENLTASHDRQKGYIDGISSKKMKVDMKMVETTDFSKESTCQAMEQLLSMKTKPEAIITFNDYVHMDAVQYALKKNVKVNKDIIFASYANLPITNYTTYPPVLSLEQYPYLQGEKAMEIMFKLFQDMQANDSNANRKYYTEVVEASVAVHD